MSAVASHQGLKNAIAQSKKTVDEWAAQQKAAADRISAGAQAEFEAFQKRMEETRATILALQMESKLCLDGNERRLRLEKELENQKKANTSLEKMLVEKKKVVATLLKKHGKQKVKATEAKKKSQTILQARSTTLDDLTRGLMNYKKLGLDFEKAEGEKLRLAFSQIDKENPQRKFAFDVAVEDDKWKVTDCPSLDTETLDSLLKPLNETNDFGPFVHGMRKAFRAIVG